MKIIVNEPSYVIKPMIKTDNVYDASDRSLTSTITATNSMLNLLSERISILENQKHRRINIPHWCGGAYRYK